MGKPQVKPDHLAPEPRALATVQLLPLLLAVGQKAVCSECGHRSGKGRRRTRPSWWPLAMESGQQCLSFWVRTFPHVGHQVCRNSVTKSIPDMSPAIRTWRRCLLQEQIVLIMSSGYWTSCSDIDFFFFYYLSVFYCLKIVLEREGEKNLALTINAILHSKHTATESTSNSRVGQTF